MPRMRKENRTLDVEPNLVEQFRREGYDHIDHETGEVIAHATGGRMVPLSEVRKLEDKLATITAEKNEEIRVLEEENMRLDKLVKQLQGRHNNK